jgi:membrane-associated phospholipid phosphatase
LRIADFKGAPKIASGECDGKSFVNRNRIVYGLIAIVLAGIVIGAAFYFDEAAERFITDHQDPTLKNFMRAVSFWGDWYTHFGLGLLMAGAAWWRGNRKWTRIFLSMLIALAVAGLATRGVKILAGRARPAVKTEEMWNGPEFSSKYHAFPSGHVAASCAFFGVLLFVNWRIGLACLSIPLVIGFSRMYVAAHYLSDVVCAMILGLLCAFFITRSLQGANRRSATAHPV